MMSAFTAVNIKVSILNKVQAQIDLQCTNKKADMRGWL